MAATREKQIDTIRTELLTIGELAARLKYGVSTIRKWLADGYCPEPLKVNGHGLRWEGWVIQQWIDDGFPHVRRKRWIPVRN